MQVDSKGGSDFSKLVRARSRWRFFLALLILVSHAFFVGGIAFYREWFAEPASQGSSVTVGIVVTASVIVFMLLIEWVYIWVSDSRFDPEQRRILDKQSEA